MKYLLLASFKADYKSLSPQEQALFKDAIRKMNQSFAHQSGQRIPSWPAALRIKSVEGAPGIWEMPGPSLARTGERLSRSSI